MSVMRRARGAKTPAAVARAPHRRLPRPLVLFAVLVLVVYPLGAGLLLLTSDGWAVNRANVRVWVFVTDLVGMRSRISPDDFAVIANVVLFVPFFAALTMLRPTWWWVLLGAALSTAVELYQGTLGSRLQDPGDIAANTLGAALGVALGFGIRRLAHRSAATTSGAHPAGSAEIPHTGSDPG